MPETVMVRRELQLKNMLFIFVQLLVSKLERSRVVRLLQHTNIPFMLETLIVLKFDKSIFFSFRHRLNIHAILTHSEVSKYSIFSIVSMHSLEYFGLELEIINTKEFKASQINHDTGEYEKIPLSQRTKIVAGHKVQRDLYSAFAMANRKDLETIDRQKCIDNFEKFLEIQERIINNLKAIGDDLPACMGIK